MLPPMTAVETEEFVDHSKATLTEAERDALVAHLGANPARNRTDPRILLAVIAYQPDAVEDALRKAS